MKYNKPPLSFPDQIALLEKRGLTISDKSMALHILEHVNYYRLNGYFPPFQYVKDRFNIGEHPYIDFVDMGFPQNWRDVLIDGKGASNP